MSPVRAPRSSLSVRQIVRRIEISRSSVTRIIKRDLHFKFLKRVFTFSLTPALQERRLLRCRYLLNVFTTRQQIQKIWFTDENIFSLSPPKNTQNDRLCVSENDKRSNVPLDRLFRERQKFAKYVMVSAGISRNFRTRLIFINQGMRLNSQHYCETVLTPMLPQIENLLPEFVFMQVSRFCSNCPNCLIKTFKL